jgi:hypothetical protein
MLNIVNKIKTLNRAFYASLYLVKNNFNLKKNDKKIYLDFKKGKFWQSYFFIIFSYLESGYVVFLKFNFKSFGGIANQGTTYLVSAGGYAGSSGNKTTTIYTSGGGGGAGSVGLNVIGGVGIENDITGINMWYAAGGGGHVLSTSSTTTISISSGSTWNITIGSGGASGGAIQNNTGKIGNNTSISGGFSVSTNNSLYSGQGGRGLSQYSSNGGGGPGDGVTSASGGTMTSTSGLLSGSGGAAGSLTYINASGSIIQILLPSNGGNSTTGVAGNGSNGFQGINEGYYGGGGGGGEFNQNLPISQIGGFGGTGGGGNGCFFKLDVYDSPTYITPPTNGVMNTGGGGGGGGGDPYVSGMGGSGTAIFKISIVRA